MTHRNIIILFIIFLVVVAGCGKPVPTEVENSVIDTSGGPIQIAYKTEDTIVKKIRHGEVIITPVAKYKVAGKLARKRSYSQWVGKVTPIFDLVLIWGKLAEPENEKYFTYGRSGWTYKSEGPLAMSYIKSHLGRYYVYPANDNIRKAVNTVKKKQKIILEGFLINTKLKYKGKFSRTVGRLEPGWCKFFYVEKIRIENNVYK